MSGLTDLTGASALMALIAQPETFANQLKSQGYRFVGPASVYAFMQNVGATNYRGTARS